MSGAPHQGLAAKAGDLVEQRLARLDIGDHRRARILRQHLARQHRQDLVAPQDSPTAVDDADAVAIAVESDAEVATVGAHGVLQLDEVGGPRWGSGW